jgi:DNA replicative helicase MCM subunit Mcm2 (Cdc46/Mcm family)
MSADNPIDLGEKDQQVLAAWRILFEKEYLPEIKDLEGLEMNVFGFEVEHDVMSKDNVLKTEFHLNPARTLSMGDKVLKEQFDQNGVLTRPIVRVVNLSTNYHRTMDELRMRDRDKLLSVDVKIAHVSHPYGWLKSAIYKCKDCGASATVEQRRARERESPSVCRICLQKSIEGIDTKDIPLAHFYPRPNFRMVTDECYYEDVQDISMRQISYNKDHHLIQCSTKFELIGTLADDLVGDIESSSFMRVNGILRVQPIPTRNFAKDTRRLLSIDVISVEPLPIVDAK